MRGLSYDEELAPGWRHLATVRERGRLKLYVDGRLASESAPFPSAATADKHLGVLSAGLPRGFGSLARINPRMSCS